MSVHASSAVVLAISAFRRSAGNLCTTPPGTRCVVIALAAVDRTALGGLHQDPTLAGEAELEALA